MLKRILLISIAVLLVLGLFSASLTLAQEPDDGAGKGEELRSDDNTAEPAPSHSPTFQRKPAESPAGNVPAVDLNNLTTPDGQTLPNPETLKAQALALANSITSDQRAQIRAVLDANPPAYMDQVKAALGNPIPSVTAAAPSAQTVAAQLTPEQLQAMDQAGRAWADQVNAGIKAVLTPEQAAAFDATLLPHPQDWAAKLGIQLQGEITPQTSTDCYYAYYYDYYYGNYYTYYQYLYGYYHDYYYSDPAAYYVYNLGYDAYIYSYYAYLYSYYAYYYYYNSTYAYYSWYFADQAAELGYAGWNLAYYSSYYWTGDYYAYYSYLYGYYGWYYDAYYGSYYGYYCYTG